MFSLNYSQIDSKPGPLTNECRGLILYRNCGASIQSFDEVVGEVKIMARPMDRFFNFGDSNAHPINFDNPNITHWNKLDGTLCILYWNPELEEWHIATRSVPMADVPIDGFGDHTFRTLFEKALMETSEQTFEIFTSKLSKEVTYCFELTTPMNRVVVDYKEFRVHLLAYRNTETGQEYNGVQNDLHGVSWCPHFKLSSVKEVLDFVSSQNPLEHEGVVAMDQNFNRVKIKNLAYTAYNRAHHLTANSPRALMELILLEKLDDVLPVLGDHVKVRAEKLQNGLINLIRETDTTFEACKLVAETNPENPRKFFALEVQKLKAWMGPLMARYSGKCDDCKDYILKQKTKTNEWPTSFLETLISECEKYA